MRVLFVISGLGLGGAERQVVLLTRELNRTGHAVSIYTLNADVARQDELPSGIELVIDQKRSRLDFQVIARLRRYIRRWKPDVVHGFLYDGDLYTRLAACGTGAPVLNSERSDNYIPSVLQRVGYRVTSALCDGVVANSHTGASFARRLHRLPPDHVHVVWNGIDLNEVDARLAAASARDSAACRHGRGTKRLCVVGSINPAKDHPLALRVVRRLVDNDPSWRLICIGDELANAFPGYKSRVLVEVERLRLHSVVQFLGHRRDVLELIAESDLMLVTSLREGFPNVVLEAMACGTAVVSTDYSDVRRILPVAEQVVASRDEASIARAVSNVFDRRAEIASLQRAWVERHATAAASMAGLLTVYRQYARSAADLHANAA